jgi:hypothetical protein
MTSFSNRSNENNVDQTKRALGRSRQRAQGLTRKRSPGIFTDADAAAASEGGNRGGVEGARVTRVGICFGLGLGGQAMRRGRVGVDEKRETPLTLSLAALFDLTRLYFCKEDISGAHRRLVHMVHILNHHHSF